MPYPYPTTTQAVKCLELCQSLSDLGRDIVLFRYNSVSGYVFILSSDEIQVTVRRDGSWRFEDET